MFSRAHPYSSRIKERILLTAPHSTKKTYHVCLDITGSNLLFRVGDSIGTLPSNDPIEVTQILQCIGANGEEEIVDKRSSYSLSIRDFLLHKANLSRVNSTFLKNLLEKGSKQREFLEHLLQGENKAHLQNYLHSHTLLELLQSHEGATLLPADLAQLLLPLMPRFYSIANSPKVFPNEIHLLVSYVHYSIDDKIRRGVGSHFLCDFAEIDSTPIPIYVQSSNHFTLPENPSTPIILVGPGTGLAPFRAFLQERLATQATGLNWLFFGERNRSSDFYYESFWTDLEKQGRLRLDLAFSRDGPEKVYVQHKMYENRKSLMHWIEQGSHFYVCGDAQKMAKEVEATLHKIICEEKNLSEEDGLLFLKKMRAEKRYLADVY